MPRADRPRTVALSALAALAVAMGIGRFAFTPILPMMQDDAGLGVAEGGWLASANYAGYFVGALSAMHAGWRARPAIRIGLVLITATTLAMAFEERFAVWLVLRALAGVASAWVLVCVSAWALERLGRAGRTDLAGTVYAGVGVGIVMAGTACLVLGGIQAGSSIAWGTLGVIALLVSVPLWWTFADGETVATNISEEKPIEGYWRLVLAYGAFGFGYIIPATFLPVMAKQVIADPAVFGWAWPVFGAAAIASTFVAARASRTKGPRSAWRAANLVMAAGVVLPAVWPGVVPIAVAAFCIGGTFMVMTMSGLQEARRAGPSQARRLMAAMTAAFALGQIAGPLLVSGLAPLRGGLSAALVIAALPLVAAAFLLSEGGKPWKPMQSACPRFRRSASTRNNAGSPRS